MDEALYNEIDKVIHQLLKDKIILRHKGMPKIRRRALSFLKSKKVVVVTNKNTSYTPTTEILEIRKMGLEKYLANMNYKKKVGPKKTIFNIDYKYIIYFLFFLTGFILNGVVHYISTESLKKQEKIKFQTQKKINNGYLKSNYKLILDQNKTIVSLKATLDSLKKNHKENNK